MIGFNKNKKESNLINTILLIILILLILLTLLLSLYDISRQLILSDRSSKISDLVITFSTYLIIIFIGSIILISRNLSFKRFLLLIPKSYLPIKQQDLPKAPYQLISNEYDRVSLITYISQPKGRNQLGWSKPNILDNSIESIHFRTEILNTIPLLESLIEPLLPPLSSTSSLSTRSRSAPLSPLNQLKSQNIIPEALTPLLDLYEELLLKAKFGIKEPKEEDWNNVIKIVAVVVGLLGNTSATS